MDSRRCLATRDGPLHILVNNAGIMAPQGVRRGVASYALDTEKAARLWHVSLEMLAGQAPMA